MLVCERSPSETDAWLDGGGNVDCVEVVGDEVPAKGRGEKDNGNMEEERPDAAANAPVMVSESVPHNQAVNGRRLGLASARFCTSST
jgi:hypothetical protein